MTVSSILFICLGNICRSPLAEGVFRHEVETSAFTHRLNIDSAGTGGWHVGDPPDPRSIEIAQAHNIDIRKQSCRQLSADDFHHFDLVLGMDKSNIKNAMTINHTGGKAEIALFAEWAGLGAMEIPDPYYGGAQGFDIAFELIERASEGVISRLGKMGSSIA